MNRRRFLGALAALPVVGRLIGALPAPASPMTFTCDTVDPAAVELSKSYVTISFPNLKPGQRYSILWVNGSKHSAYEHGSDGVAPCVKMFKAGERQ